MLFYLAINDPYVVHIFGDLPTIRHVPALINPLAEGSVLETGSESGANFTYCDPARTK
jgi:hypothetical protein